MRGLGVGVSSSLIATAIVYWIADHNVIRALVIAGAGIAGFLLTYFFTKKPAPPTAVPPMSVHQENIQEFNPRLSINIGSADQKPEEEKLQLEEAAILFMKTTHPATGYETREIATALDLKYHEARAVLERLLAKHRVFVVSDISISDSDGKAWFLEYAER